MELASAEILSLFADCVRRAERLRAVGGEVVFVTGVELGLMTREFLPGDTVRARLEFLLGNPNTRQERLAELVARLDKFLGEAVVVVHEHFRGNLTYCAISFERLDWLPFDLMLIELIRSAEVADRFRADVRELVAQRKPLAITGFGAATWRGAADTAPTVTVLGLASLGIVKVLEDRRAAGKPDMAGEPRAAFTAVAECYGTGMKR
ncbi:hypothetical protein [Nocardia panacis]|uniref:hypothetical protein n=1 Tax=Nocardia panacis TaxID=2340916 RepID=UPI001EF06E2D|nr:hypothetical protein [Nocardia panacis]